MINARLMWSLESQGLLSEKQCGFRKNHSTLDHLVRFETFIRNAFVKKEHVLTIFFDIEKAYDTTWKHGILADLWNLGFRGHLSRFIQSFLSERSFRIRVGSTLSELHDRLLVRSKLDYGCIVYGSARRSILKQLDPIHHQGL